MEKKVYVVSIEEIADMCDYPHAPRVFSTKENALKYLKESYEGVEQEFDDEDYIKEYTDGDDTACIYKDGRWSEDRWVIRMDECVIDSDL